ncbi:MAG: phosphatase PAP2 family protein [Rubripirellula sp.]|jgi:hypothetical protein
MQTTKLTTWSTRFAFVIVGLFLWHLTQSWIGQRELMPGAIGDGVHDWLAGANAYLHQHPNRTNQLLITSSAVIDLLGFFLLWRSIFGPSLRPFIGLLLLFGMRQVCQLVCALEPPPGMLWRDPGFPSLLVTYGVTTDFFFSGHTGLAVLGAVEIARMGGRRWMILGGAIIVFEVMTVLVLRAHYTMDVFTGAVAARYATLLASRIAPSCDALLGRIVGHAPTLQESTLSEVQLDATEYSSAEPGSDRANSPESQRP